MTDSSGVASAAAPGRRRRGRPRREVGRKQLTDAGQLLFEEGGPDAVSIEAAAAHLNVSRATLYRAIPSKEDLIELVLQRAADELCTAARSIARRPGLTSRERVEHLARMLVDLSIRRPRSVLALVDSEIAASGAELAGTGRGFGAWRDYQGIWTRVVRAAIKSGDLPADDPRVIAQLITSMLIAVARQTLTSGGGDARSTADVALRLMLRDRRGGNAQDQPAQQGAQRLNERITRSDSNTDAPGLAPVVTAARFSSDAR